MMLVGGGVAGGGGSSGAGGVPSGVDGGGGAVGVDGGGLAGARVFSGSVGGVGTGVSVLVGGVGEPPPYRQHDDPEPAACASASVRSPHSTDGHRPQLYRCFLCLLAARLWLRFGDERIPGCYLVHEEGSIA